MATSLNLQYTINVSADTNTSAETGDYSIADSVQQQISYNTNSLVNPSAKRIEIAAYPTPFSAPINTRVYDINLEAMNIGFLRLLSATCEFPFLISKSDSAAGLNTAVRELSKGYFIDRGPEPNPATFTPDIPFPQHLRIINPIEINGGGTGNDITDTPIIVSVFILCDQGNID